MTIATILYEDRKGQLSQHFGLHRFILRCVADAIPCEPPLTVQELEPHLDGRPMKGVGNLLRSLREDAADVASDGRSLVVIVDDDQIREYLGLTVQASREETRAALVDLVPKGISVEAFLLRDNLESVLRALASCDPTLSRDKLHRAIERKDLSARDALLGEATFFSAPVVRRCVLKAVPSLAEAVHHLARLIKSWLGATASDAEDVDILDLLYSD